MMTKSEKRMYEIMKKAIRDSNQDRNAIEDKMSFLNIDELLHQGTQCEMCEMTPIKGKLYIEFNQQKNYCERCALLSIYGKESAFIVKLRPESKIPPQNNNDNFDAYAP